MLFLSDVDYIPVSEEMAFSANESLISISVQIINDLLTEGSETFTVRISEVSGTEGRMFIASPNFVNITIKDDES